ncbi:MAG: hypothetical protein KY467_18665 [Gemmatimonadetes bacterium]|nr:hypothetical protein [Gemmatimonadota bacterium]
MRLRSFLLSATAALLAGCTPFGPCTLIGCDDGLAVQFSRPPAGSFRLEATVPNDPSVRAIECDAAATCLLIFPGLTAPQVTLRLITAEGTLTQQFQPRYQDQYPNGRRCGTACRQATVTFQLPA